MLSASPLAPPPAVPALPLAVPLLVPAVEDVRARAWAVLKGLQAGSGPCDVERRRRQRVPFPYPLSLTPVDRETLAPLGPAVVVLGKQLAEEGIDFYHAQPLPYRYMAAELTCPNGARVRFLLELHWCRFNQHGLYENGGRFLLCLQ